ncbi:MAG: ABC transporter substrate-binding protein [Rhodospirillum sp.]|nr:ABC transporter substrate-binding protein [Rhodospirillum sp.]MCF8489458.1 ABC transporter substrate-binding protein [Rhodospirillum sp.]MCF8500826.1 ABC transporter substrate-binding protein [Rhodospirillum sp.]
MKIQLKSTAAIVALSSLVAPAAMAEETIKLGLSVPLSGAAAVWGKGAEFMCETAADEIREDGGISVGGETYNFACLPYDNKYNAAEGTKVAQALLNREGVRYIGGSLGTAPVKALQSLAERQGVLVFTVAWGASLKGTDHPMTFTQMNTPGEILPVLLRYVAERHPDAKSVAMLNPNDATGQETEALASKVWTKNNVDVLTSDFYERGTTEFQPIAARLASMNPAMIDLGATPPADAGAIFKELDVLGWDGVKIVEVGTGADGLKATGGAAADGVYMGAGVTFDGDTVTDHQKAVNTRAKERIGESLNAVQIGFYDSLYALKAAMEKADSIEPEAVADSLPRVTFRTFYGGEIGFYGTNIYGRDQQMRLPIIVTQVRDGQLEEVARLIP